MNYDNYQEAQIIINGDKVFIFLGKGENDEILIESESMWSDVLGISYHQYSYKNDIMPIIGREDEEEKIKEFLEEKEFFKINAITGRAGNGKSRLVYNIFKDERIKQEWSVYGLRYEELQYFKFKYICQMIEKGLIKEKILFIIDYVSINARQIGKWILKLYLDRKKSEEEIYIRILLVERAHVEKDRKPYWYTCLVEENRLEELGLCNYSNHLQIHNLKDDQLKQIFLEYIKRNEEKYKKIYGMELDYNICEIEAEKIIGALEKECKTPLYIMYIADAWINDNSKKGRNWSREDALEYVVQKENERIEVFFGGNKKKESALKRIIVFCTVLNGINLGEGRPSFLDEEFELIREELGDGNPTLRHLFNEVGKLENTKEIILKPILPEIVGEYYCLWFLYNTINNSFDNTYIRKFIQYVWEEKPRESAGFLCRIIEDFSDHSLVDFSGILQMPILNKAEIKVFYADVLREYTFWNKKISNYYEIIFSNFDKLLNGETCKEIIIDICEKYIITLFNMGWWCKRDVHCKKVDECIEMILFKRDEICNCISDHNICRTCVLIKRMLGETGTKDECMN